MYHSSDVSELSGAQQGQATQTYSQGEQEPEVVKTHFNETP